jgi:hypothetical protein
VADKPLLLHWRPLWPEQLLDRLGLATPKKAHDEAVLVSILGEAHLADRADPESRLSYSRRPDFYTRSQRYRGPAFSFRRVVPTIDPLPSSSLPAPPWSLVLVLPLDRQGDLFGGDLGSVPASDLFGWSGGVPPVSVRQAIRREIPSHPSSPNSVDDREGALAALGSVESPRLHGSYLPPIGSRPLFKSGPGFL